MRMAARSRGALLVPAAALLLSLIPSGASAQSGLEIMQMERELQRAKDEE